jgi:uncharacterized Rossmann fold enzyme
VKTLDKLAGCHAGERIVVMGGGPSLGADLARLPDDVADIWISANHHGAALREVDYVVALDDVHDQLHRPMRELIREHTEAPIVSPHDWADIRMAGWWPLTLMLTGPVAAWVASHFGARRVILAGFDCYASKPSALNAHRRMAAFIKSEVRVVSGPLIELYRAWSPEEAFA